MKHSTNRPTKVEQERFQRLLEIGCIISLRFLGFYSPAEIHHLLSGNRRRGHLYTIPLNPWFHRGVPIAPMGIKWHEENYGPSLARTPKKFREVFGTDDQLLALTNEKLEAA